MKKESAGKPELEYRYYEMIPGGPALFLNKEGIYKEDADVPHFHNVMEIGYCYQGKGCMLLRDERVPFEEGTFTLISGKFPHMTISEGDVFGGWKYLFVDAEGLLREFYGKESVTARRLLSGIEQKSFRLLFYHLFYYNPRRFTSMNPAKTLPEAAPERPTA